MHQALSGAIQPLYRCLNKVHVAVYARIVTMSTLTPTHDENLSPNTKSILGFLGIHIRYSEFVELCNDIKSHPPQELWEVAAREVSRTRKHSTRQQLNETTRDLVKADLY